jgi:hypothetical protein
VARIGFLFHVAAQNMGEGLHKFRLLGDEPQQVGDADARQLAVERTIDGFFFRGKDKRPAALVPTASDLDVLVVAILNPLVDTLELLFELRMEGGERFFDRHHQNRRADLAQHCFLVLPPLGADQVILAAAEFIAVPDI